MFTVIPDAMAVTCQNGVFRQVKVFKYRGLLFAQHGSGYIYLYHNDSTSHPTVRLDDIELPFEKVMNGLGRLCLPDQKGAQPVKAK